MKIVLGSKSEGRKKVLEDAGYNFEIITAEINEKDIRRENPQDLVLELANAKADAIINKIKDPVLLITADQVVVCNNMILEKPKDRDEARKFVRYYEEHPMETISSLVVTNTKTGKRVEGIDIARVYFNPIPEKVIEQAIEIGRIMHCAGAMRCEEKPFSDYVAKFEGTKDSTSGMPLNLLRQLIQKVS